MSKKILGVVAGQVVWVTIVMVAGTIMRLSWPDYARVEIAMTSEKRHRAVPKA